jgi:hypothetical protein
MISVMEIDTVFRELLDKIDKTPEKAVFYIKEAWDNIHRAMQKSNANIFEDLLTQMTPLPFK